MKFPVASTLALLASFVALAFAVDNTTVVSSNTTDAGNTTSVGNATSSSNITAAGNATSAGGVAAMGGSNSTATPIYNMTGNGNSSAIAPKVVVVTLFELERNVWAKGLQFTRNISLPGGSPLFPYVTCDNNADVCLITTGEGEINAASTFTSFLFSSQFDLRKTYFVVNGIAGVNPHAGTVGSVSLTRFAIQFGLQYGLDAREAPQGWNYSFWNYGTDTPGQYPTFFYGTEIFEVNTNLRDKVFELVQNVTLSDNDAAKANRANFTYAPANQPPAVFKGDVTTSDLYFTGEDFGDLASNLTMVLTNGTGSYAMTAQEDNAVLEVLVRAHKAGFADYGRAILYRSGSDFDRAPDLSNDYNNIIFNNNSTDLVDPSVANLFTVGIPIVQAIVANWTQEWEQGVTPQNSTSYGDVFGTLLS